MTTRKRNGEIPPPTFTPVEQPTPMEEKEELFEVLNNQRGRDQHLGWGVYRAGKIYIVGSSKQHALLNLSQGRNILNLPEN